MAAIGILIAFGLLLIAGPIVAGTLGVELGTATSVILTGSGIASLVLAGIFTAITKLYQKTKASEAIVKTGMGGLKVIQDGGMFVIPFVHQLTRISLETLKLEVKRVGKDALITEGGMRADIHGEFFVRVQADTESIKNASRSFGERMNSREYVASLVEDKLVSALRTVAAKMTLEQLNAERDQFVSQVETIVKHELEPNGLTLESVTISHLDQTDPSTLTENNVFNAQGAMNAQNIIQSALTKKNQIVREGEQAREAQDVETRKKVLTLQQDQANAEAEQSAEVAKIRAEKEREAKEKQIEAQRQVELAEVEKQKQLEVAQRRQQEAAEVAERNKQKAITEAEQQLEVAKRKQQEAIAQAEAERALKEAEQAEAEAKREEARQAIKTVEVKATAERDAEQQVISAKAKAEQEYVEAQRRADAQAYGVTKDAEARKAAADADAEAVTKKAKADAEAKRLSAEGDKALQMVPVEVESRRVDVEQRRVDVLKQELQARDEHGKVAQDFEVTKMRITKEAEVQIAVANATATLAGKMEATLVGTPADVEKLLAGYRNGMGFARMIEGFIDGTQGDTADLAGRALAAGTSLVKTALDKRGKDGASPEAPAPTPASTPAPKGKTAGATAAKAADDPDAE